MVALLRGRAHAGQAHHRMVDVAAIAQAPLRGHVRRRPRDHGGGQSRRARKPAARPSGSTSGCRSSRGPTRTSPTGCTSSSTTSSCASSGSPTWPRPWWCFRAASARWTKCSSCSRWRRRRSWRSRFRSSSTGRSTGIRSSSSIRWSNGAPSTPAIRDLVQRADTPQQAFELLRVHLTTHHLEAPEPEAKRLQAPQLAKTRR